MMRSEHLVQSTLFLQRQQHLIPKNASVARVNLRKGEAVNRDSLFSLPSAVTVAEGHGWAGAEIAHAIG